MSVIYCASKTTIQPIASLLLVWWPKIMDSYPYLVGGLRNVSRSSHSRTGNQNWAEEKYG